MQQTPNEPTEAQLKTKLKKVDQAIKLLSHAREIIDRTLKEVEGLQLDEEIQQQAPKKQQRVSKKMKREEILAAYRLKLIKKGVIKP